MAFAGECSVQVQLQMLEHVQVHRHMQVHVHVPSVYSVFVSRYVLLGGSGFVKFRLIHVKLLQFHFAY